MESCKQCKSTDIQSHKNYTHGKKSKATIILSCKRCGSKDIETKPDRWSKPRRR